MSLVEFHIILGVSFMLGFIPRVSSALLKQNKAMQSNLSFEQKEMLTEMPKNLKRELVFILGVIGLHFFTILFFEFSPQRVDSASAPIHILVPLSFIVMMVLLTYCSFLVNNTWKQFLVQNNFPQVFISAREEFFRSVTISIGLVLMIFLIGWFIMTKVDLMKIILQFI